MQRTLSLFLAVLGLSFSSAKASMYVGAGIGYLIDSKEAFVSLRVGGELPISRNLEIPNRFSHNLEFEVGFIDLGDNSFDFDVTPFFLNYRIESNGLGFVPYFGAGIGGASIDVDSGFFSDDDLAFAAQAFAGIKYNFSEATALSLGARYIWVDDVKFFGVPAKMGDDVSIEVGFSLRF